MTIEQNLLPLCRSCRVALKLGIYYWVVLIISVQHLSLRTMLFEKCAKECSTTTAVLSMVTPRGNGLV